MPQYGNEEEKTLTYDKIKIRLARRFVLRAYFWTKQRLGMSLR